MLPTHDLLVDPKTAAPPTRGPFPSFFLSLANTHCRTVQLLGTPNTRVGVSLYGQRLWCSVRSTLAASTLRSVAARVTRHRLFFDAELRTFNRRAFLFSSPFAARPAKVQPRRVCPLGPRLGPSFEGMLINGEKFACESCVKGHRVSNCTHSGKFRPLAFASGITLTPQTALLSILPPRVDQSSSVSTAGMLESPNLITPSATAAASVLKTRSRASPRVSRQLAWIDHG